MRVLLLLALCTAALANGPAWVAELSAVDPPHIDNLQVTIPVGSHVAIGVYNTDAVAPEPPAGVSATVRVIWYEHRTVFTGMAEERETATPYYLPEPKDCAPTGAFAVELEPAKVGEYTVPIACNSNTVTVNLTCIDLPASEIGYGFYTDYVRFADPKRGPDYYRDMAAHGFNTFTPYARELPGEFGVDNRDSAALLGWHINTAIACGLVDARYPLACLSCAPEAIRDAKSRYGAPTWPELVSYNQDEPGLAAKAQVAQYAEDAHALGIRSGTAINGDVALEIGDPLDIWILHMDSMTQRAIDACRMRDKARWLYNCSLRGSNAALHRYWAGVYTWAMAPEVCLTWTYMHDPGSRIRPDGTWDLRRVYDTATCDADGKPIPTVALEGMQEGIIDSRLLQALERKQSAAGQAYLDALRARVDMAFWPGGRTREYSSYPWDVPDTAVPPIDLVQMREDVLRLLKGGE